MFCHDKVSAAMNLTFGAVKITQTLLKNIKFGLHMRVTVCNSTLVILTFL